MLEIFAHVPCNIQILTSTIKFNSLKKTKLLLKTEFGIGEMAWQVRVLATKSNDLI